MLDLSVPVRTVEGVELAVDDSAPRSFLVLPSAPALAVSDGTPEIDLLRFVREGQITGGHLRLVTTLPSDERALARARAFLADEARVDVEQIALRPIPVESANAQSGLPRARDDRRWRPDRSRGSPVQHQPGTVRLTPHGGVFDRPHGRRRPID